MDISNTAADTGHLEVVKLLLDHGADATVANDDGRLPFYSAAFSGNVEFLKLLLPCTGQDGNVNAFGRRYGKVIHATAYKGHLNAIQTLVE
ncbi:ankyrin repeat protein [Zopfia rhizophila CBS 207.26]|uniref:Ankyrin repeat protein n=1 Tax=Zopfia rhizophila CBS 207.26 TaxID=1314779 RepID=A0A6A6DJ88_9PEZI|nr:ankyrin repeat protein [Zopfia rhizophila CBS 207.26]